jgi:hypothetical protein
MLGVAVCETTKAHFRELLNAGHADQVERELHAGLNFAVQVRALAELATPDAAQLLERQLARTHTGDPVEQSWYWVDVAIALRQLNHADALPAVLRCAEAAMGTPQGAMLAAEAVAFPKFVNLLRHPNWDVGRMAIRAVVTATRAARASSVEIGTLIRAGLGELLAETASRHDVTLDPWMTLAVIEAERFFRRLGHWSRFLPTELRIEAERQAMRLWATADRRRDWLDEAPAKLIARFPHANTDEQAAALQCLFELRADMTQLFPHLPDRRVPWWADAVRALQWSRSAVVGPVLASQALRFARKTRHHNRAATLLLTLRGHACYETERVLLRLATTANPVLRYAAIRSLGWWPPFDPDRMIRVLREARAEPDTELRYHAVSALARLGERAALAEVAAGLMSEEPSIRVATTARVSQEELSWLWPNVEDIAASQDAETALAATEALESLRERFLGFSSSASG